MTDDERLAAVRRTARDAADATSAVLRTAAKPKPPVLAYHVIFGAYGFWLPNDPRGSWSDFVAAWELFLAGGHATKTTTRRSVARALARRGGAAAGPSSR